MVKIKTNLNDTGKNKVTLTDLNTNILNLTAAVKGNSEIMKASVSNIAKIKSSTRSSSSSDKDINDKKDNHSWYYNAAAAAWKSSEVYKQRSNIGSTAIGGLTGISPVLVQKLGIDKAVGSILKSTIGGIKKKWAEAGISKPKNNNINSAVESNQISGTNKRLDKLYALLKDKKTAEVKAEKENKGFFSKILSFVGSLLGPILKIALGTIAVIGIAHMVSKIARWFGWKPKESAPVVHGAGTGIKSIANTHTNLLKNEKAYRDALRDYMEDPYFKEMSPQERTKALKEVPKNAPKEFIKKRNKYIEARTNLYETRGATTKAIEKAGISANKSATNMVNNKITSKFTEPIKYTTKSAGIKLEKFTGKALNTIGTGLIIYDTAGRVVDDIKAGDYGKAGADTARGAATWGGMTLGGKAGAKLGKGWWKLLTGAVGAGVGALLGKKGTEALFPEYFNQLSLEELAETKPWKVRHPYEQLYGVHPGSKAFTDKLIEDQISGKYGYVPKWRNNQLGGFTKFMLERASKYVPGMGGEEYYWDWANGKPTWTHGVTNQFLDPQWKAYVYAQGRLGRPMPEIPKSAYQGQIGYEHAKSTTDGDYDYIYQQGISDREKASKKNQEYGVTTDFSSPIEAADQVNSTTEGIAENTKGTNDILKDILHTLEKLTGNDMTTPYPFTPINNTLPANESATQNTSFPNPLLQYMSTRGKM